MRSRLHKKHVRGDADDDPISDDDLVYADSSDDDVKKGNANANKQRRNKYFKPIVSFDLETARGLSELDVFNPNLNLKDIYTFKEMEMSYDLPDKEEAQNYYAERLANNDFEGDHSRGEERGKIAFKAKIEAASNNESKSDIDGQMRHRKRGKNNNDSSRADRNKWKKSKPKSNIEEITLSDDDDGNFLAEIGLSSLSSGICEKVFVEYDSPLDLLSLVTVPTEQSDEGNSLKSIPTICPAK
jgi:hypothetical protein